jgi:hypothetical protein
MKPASGLRTFGLDSSEAIKRALGEDLSHDGD